jgi:hypothetical protein
MSNLFSQSIQQFRKIYDFSYIQNNPDIQKVKLEWPLRITNNIEVSTATNASSSNKFKSNGNVVIAEFNPSIFKKETLDTKAEDVEFLLKYFFIITSIQSNIYKTIGDYLETKFLFNEGNGKYDANLQELNKYQQFIYLRYDKRNNVYYLRIRRKFKHKIYYRQHSASETVYNISNNGAVKHKLFDNLINYYDFDYVFSSKGVDENTKKTYKGEADGYFGSAEWSKDATFQTAILAFPNNIKIMYCLFYIIQYYLINVIIDPSIIDSIRAGAQTVEYFIADFLFAKILEPYDTKKIKISAYNNWLERSIINQLKDILGDTTLLQPQVDGNNNNNNNNNNPGGTMQSNMNLFISDILNSKIHVDFDEKSILNEIRQNTNIDTQMEDLFQKEFEGFKGIKLISSTNSSNDNNEDNINKDDMKIKSQFQNESTIDVNISNKSDQQHSNNHKEVLNLKDMMDNLNISDISFDDNLEFDVNASVNINKNDSNNNNNTIHNINYDNLFGPAQDDYDTWE